MSELLYQPKNGLIPFDHSQHHGAEAYKLDPNRRVYSQRQWEGFKKENWFREDAWTVYAFGVHDSSVEIPQFRGWTPAIEFENSGFKLEQRVDLLKIGRDVSPGSLSQGGAFQIGTGQQGSVRVKEVTPADLAYGRENAGTAGIFEKHGEEITAVFDRLHEQNTEFVVFRTYRGWPAVWDYVYFFSQGEFKL